MSAQADESVVRGLNVRAKAKQFVRREMNI